MLFTPFSLNISRRDTFFHVSLISLGFYLFPERLLNFLWLVHSTMCEKRFQYMVFAFLENTLNLCIFTHIPVPNSKLQVGSVKNLFPSRWKVWKKLWFALLKFNQKQWRWLVTLVHLCFVWCDFVWYVF